MKYIKFELFKYLYLCNVIFHISTVIKLSSNHLDTFYFTYPLIFFLSLKSHHDFSTSKDLSIRFINVLRQSIAVKFKTELRILKKMYISYTSWNFWKYLNFDFFRNNECFDDTIHVSLLEWGFFMRRNI